MKWEWVLVEEVLEALGLWSMNEYIWMWQANIAEYIENLCIYKLCTGLEWMPVSIRSVWCL